MAQKSIVDKVKDGVNKLVEKIKAATQRKSSSPNGRHSGSSSPTTPPRTTPGGPTANRHQV